MILESLFVLLVLLVILVFFYKRAIHEFNILQVESLDKGFQSLGDLSPIVVHPWATQIPLWTRADLTQRPQLLQSLLPGLMMTLDKGLTATSVQVNPQHAETLATKAGLPVLATQTLLPTFKETVWWGPLATTRTEALIGAQGLRQTYGYVTAVQCTEGALAVSLVTEASDPYLPAAWKGKRLSKLTRDEAPLLAQIQYVDVIVRPGSLLLVPPHWRICWETHESDKPALAVWTEIHHPISRFVAHVQRRG